MAASGALTTKISIHAPREGSDTLKPERLRQILQFQSTLPVKGATYAGNETPSYYDISIHAPREGSDNNMGLLDDIKKISIHAPREGSDNASQTSWDVNNISIHAPREGSDITGNIYKRAAD